MAESLLSAVLFGVVDMEHGSSASEQDTREVACTRRYVEKTDEYGHCVLFNPTALQHSSTPASHPVFFFDLDNTIYPKSSGIDHMMARRIELFFTEKLRLPLSQAKELGARYYRDYGLSIKGLIKDFAIVPTEYDEYVDCGLPLDDLLRPDAELKRAIRNLNKNHGPCWIFTNAGKTHALRVLRLMELDSSEYLQGVIYCDYAEPDFPAKPDRMAFDRAMRRCGVRAEDPSDRRRCFFFDDSLANLKVGRDLGWQVVHVNETAESLESELGTLSPVAQVDMPAIRMAVEVEQYFLSRIANE